MAKRILGCTGMPWPTPALSSEQSRCSICRDGPAIVAAMLVLWMHSMYMGQGTVTQRHGHVHKASLAPSPSWGGYEEAACITLCPLSLPGWLP